MNWAICCAILAACVLCFIVGIVIGMSMKFESEKQEAFKKICKVA